MYWGRNSSKDCGFPVGVLFSTCIYNYSVACNLLDYQRVNSSQPCHNQSSTSSEQRELL